MPECSINCNIYTNAASINDTLTYNQTRNMLHALYPHCLLYSYYNRQYGYNMPEWSINCNIYTNAASINDTLTYNQTRNMLHALYPHCLLYSYYNRQYGYNMPECSINCTSAQTRHLSKIR